MVSFVFFSSTDVSEAVRHGWYNCGFPLRLLKFGQRLSTFYNSVFNGAFSNQTKRLVMHWNLTCVTRGQKVGLTFAPWLWVTWCVKFWYNSNATKSSIFYHSCHVFGCVDVCPRCVSSLKTCDATELVQRWYCCSLHWPYICFKSASRPFFFCRIT